MKDNHEVKLPRRKMSTREWVVPWYTNGKLNEARTYYTDSKQDALDTYKAMCKSANGENAQAAAAAREQASPETTDQNWLGAKCTKCGKKLYTRSDMLCTSCENDALRQRLALRETLVNDLGAENQKLRDALERIAHRGAGPTLRESFEMCKLIAQEAIKP